MLSSILILAYSKENIIINDNKIRNFNDWKVVPLPKLVIICPKEIKENKIKIYNKYLNVFNKYY